jgi:hypothetical protein
MDWSKRRQNFIKAVLTACAVALIAVVVIATVYKAPSCTDGKKDQGELGIDCGGPCPYLCSSNENPPEVTFTRALSPEQGRTDIISYVANTNADAAAQNVPYTIEAYDNSNRLVESKTGTVTLLPATTVPIFIPNFYHGTDHVASAFLTFNVGTSTNFWYRDNARPILPGVSSIDGLNTNPPKITAILKNPIAYTTYNETVIATVFDATGNAIAASQTVIPTFPSQGSVPVVFTWNQPFASKAVRVEILPASS